MKKINWKSEEDKKSSLAIEYIFGFLIILILFFIINILVVSDSTAQTVHIEMSNVNTQNSIINQSSSNSNLQILDYENLSYYIKVNIQTQVVTVFTCDEEGIYNIPVKYMICSTGISTPDSGVYTVSDKYEWAYLAGNVYGQYATRITGPILFHSVPYTRESNDSLEYWEFDKLGQPVSLGCVRLTVADAKWIYSYCKPGTKVEFCYESNDDYQNLKEMISISECSDELRNWDPTDPNPNNPWLNYNKQDEGEIN